MKDYKILSDLVKLNTIQDKENKEILDYIENYLLKFNFKTEYKGKYLIMSIGETPKLGFLGHTDTVEYIEGWNSNPFELTKIYNRLYGLGACDMKGGIAAILDAVSKIDFSKLKYGMKLYFTYDEEIGFSGIYDIVNSIKAHSSNPAKGKSANMNAVKFIMELDEFYNDKIKKYKESCFEIPYTTMNVGTINGGSAKNSVSANCEISIDFRIANKKHIKAIKEKIENLSKKYECEINLIEEIEPFIDKTDLVDTIKTANFITEASFMQTKNRIILGVGPITAHEVNEYITEESYMNLVEQYKMIIERICKD